MRLFLQKMYGMMAKNFTKSDKVSAMKNESTDVISFIIMKILSLTNRLF
jgi:hypothetical protein